MSISSTTRKAGPYSCNGSTVAFPFSFKIFQASDVRVIRTDTNEAESDLVLGTNYTVALNADQDANPGGTVTTVATYAAGNLITLTSKLENLQPVVLTNMGGFYPKVINNALDRLTILIQQAVEQVGRAVKTPISSGLTPDQLIADLYAVEANAGNSATAAANSAANAAASAAAAAATLDNFDDRYLGQKTADPTLDNDGNPLQIGALYYNTVEGVMRVFTGTGWIDAATGVNSDDVAFLQSGANAVARKVQDKLREFVSVKDFGASASATAAQNLAAFKNAVAAVVTGGKLIIPVDSSFYTIDTSGGLSSAIEINKQMEIVLEGDVKANFGTMQANPPYLFNVSANGVTFSGHGRLIGNGTIDDTNAGTIDTFPGLVYVTGNGFTFSGPVIDTPPKVGIVLRNCEKAKIQSSTFMGGPAVYTIGNTAHFGIYSYLGGQHIISGNHFVPSASGGMFTNCVFFSSTNRSTLNGNICKGAWEKFSYLYGDYNIVSNNRFEAPAGGNYTDAFRHSGSYNKLTGNIAIGAKGACQVFDGVGNEISNNQFIGCFQAGIIVGQNDAGYVGGFDYTKIIGNTLIGGVGTKTDGIRVYVNGASSKYIEICNNVISSMTALNTEGLIRVMALSPYSIEFANVSENILTGGTNGVYLDRVVRSKVSGNVINSVTSYAVSENGGAYNRFAGNQVRNAANIGIQGLSAASEGSGNQYTDANLVGVCSLSAAITTTVAHGGVAPNARVFLREANNAAGLLVSAKGNAVTGVSGTGFTISMPNGTAAAGGEAYHYRIEQ